MSGDFQEVYKGFRDGKVEMHDISLPHLRRIYSAVAREAIKESSSNLIFPRKSGHENHAAVASFS